MASSIKVNGDGTVTISLSWTNTVAIVTTTLDEAAHALYERKPLEVDGVVVPWEAMTNLQKLGLLEAEALRIFRHLAKGRMFDTRQAVMRAEAEADDAAIL